MTTLRRRLKGLWQKGKRSPDALREERGCKFVSFSARRVGHSALVPLVAFSSRREKSEGTNLSRKSGHKLNT